MTRVICRLTAKNRDQLRNPTLGNQVWATETITFFQLKTFFTVSPPRCRNMPFTNINLFNRTENTLSFYSEKLKNTFARIYEKITYLNLCKTSINSSSSSSFNPMSAA